MLILKQTPTERIVMYGYENIHDFIKSHNELIGERVFSGRRPELLENSENFWDDVVEDIDVHIQRDGYTDGCTDYKDYQHPDWLWFKSAKESGLSALSQVKGEYILIVRQGLK